MPGTNAILSHSISTFAKTYGMNKKTFSLLFGMFQMCIIFQFTSFIHIHYFNLVGYLIFIYAPDAPSIYVVLGCSCSSFFLFFSSVCENMLREKGKKERETEIKRQKDMESFDFGSLIRYLNGIKFTYVCLLATISVRNSFLLRVLYERKQNTRNM